MKKWMVAVSFAAALSLMMAMGCSKSTPDKSAKKHSGPGRDTAARQTSTGSHAAALTGRMGGAEFPPPENPAALEKEYRSAADANGRSEAAYKLGSLGTREAAEILGRLFKSEADADVKEDILNALSVVDGQEKLKLGILKMGVRPDQPDNVRKAAIEGLGDLEDSEAITVLKSLANDPKEEIRQTAKDTIETSQASSEMQSAQ